MSQNGACKDDFVDLEIAKCSVHHTTTWCFSLYSVVFLTLRRDTPHAAA